MHGDIKAANVLLTMAATCTRHPWPAAAEQQHQPVNNEAAAAETPASNGPPLDLTAKVADFGLSLLLGPTDTHATFNSRVST